MSVATGLRHIECEGAFNIRDLGGYVTSEGRRVRWRTLYRADGLHRVPATAAAVVEELGWRTVLDLRTPGEVDGGTFAAPGTAWVHLPILRSTWEGMPAVADGDEAMFLSARYGEMLEEGAAAIATAFEILASLERLPAVFHCSAGKDRTGVLAALLLSVLGVDDEQIADDYHLSGLAMEKLVAWVRRTQPELLDRMTDQPAAFLACPPEAILRFLDDLRARFGSVPEYLLGIGVRPAAIAACRAALLEE